MDETGLFKVVTEPVVVEEVLAGLVEPPIGAVALFVGTVRGETGGREVHHLEYESYPEMAEETLRQIGAEIRARWPDIRRVVVVHRVGHLDIGEVAVVIALSAAHRPPLFDALRYGVDRLKEIVPIWKKEVWAGGEKWVSEGESREKSS